MCWVYSLKWKGKRKFKMASTWCKYDFILFGCNGVQLGRQRVQFQPATVSLPTSAPYVRLSPREVFDTCPWTDWGEIYNLVETSGCKDAKRVQFSSILVSTVRSNGPKHSDSPLETWSCFFKRRLDFVKNYSVCLESESWICFISLICNVKTRFRCISELTDKNLWVFLL